MKHIRALRPSRRAVILFCIWAALILLDIAGLIWNIVRHQNGVIDDGKFSRALLHFFLTIATVSAVFVAERLFHFRAGAPLAVCCALFAFCGNCVANVWGMYDIFPAWDMVLHSLSGVLFAALGLGVSSVLLRNQPEGRRKVFAAVLLTLFFSLTIGYLWEIFEFTVDTIDPASSTQGWKEGILASNPDGTYLVSSRRGTAILDTMEDMILHLLGSLVVLIPLLFVFLRRPSRMALFAFTPVPRKRGAPEAPDGQNDTRSE